MLLDRGQAALLQVHLLGAGADLVRDDRQRTPAICKQLLRNLNGQPRRPGY